MELTNKSPYWIDLMPDGGTLVIIYPWCIEDGFTIEQIATKIYERMGEPKEMSAINLTKPYPPPYSNQRPFCMIYSHQNMPTELKDISERMTTAMLLKHLGLDKPFGD